MSRAVCCELMGGQANKYEYYDGSGGSSWKYGLRVEITMCPHPTMRPPLNASQIGPRPGARIMGGAFTHRGLHRCMEKRLNSHLLHRLYCQGEFPTLHAAREHQHNPGRASRDGGIHTAMSGQTATAVVINLHPRGIICMIHICIHPQRMAGWRLRTNKTEKVVHCSVPAWKWRMMSHRAVRSHFQSRQRCNCMGQCNRPYQYSYLYVHSHRQRVRD